MRILHTADWHLNNRLVRIDRTDDLCARLNEIAGILENHQVDVMIVAGDILDGGGMDQHRTAITHISNAFTPFLQRGGAIVATTGNHDNPTFFYTLRTALDLVAPSRTAQGASQGLGRLYLAPKAERICLRDGAGQVVQFLLMPYPTAAYLPKTQAPFSSVAEKHRAIYETYRQVLTHLRSPANGFDETLPTVLVSHIHVRGVQPHPLFRMSENEDVVFEPGDIPAYFAYTAYGHIHKAQPVLESAPHIRYAGSIDRLDLGERDDEKSVVLFDIGPSKRVDHLEVIPLNATPLFEITVSCASDLEVLRQQHQDTHNSLVRYKLTCQPEEIDALCQGIAELFPRWYARELPSWKPVMMNGGSSGEVEIPLSDVQSNVKRYLGKQLSSCEDWDELAKLIDILLEAEANGSEVPA